MNLKACYTHSYTCDIFEHIILVGLGALTIWVGAALVSIALLYFVNKVAETKFVKKHFQFLFK